MDKIPVDKVKTFEKEFLGLLVAQHKDVLETLRVGKLDEQSTDTLKTVAKELSSKYHQ